MRQGVTATRRPWSRLAGVGLRGFTEVLHEGGGYRQCASHLAAYAGPGEELRQVECSWWRAAISAQVWQGRRRVNGARSCRGWLQIGQIGRVGFSVCGCGGGPVGPGGGLAGGVRYRVSPWVHPICRALALQTRSWWWSGRAMGWAISCSVAHAGAVRGCFELEAPAMFEAAVDYCGGSADGMIARSRVSRRWSTCAKPVSTLRMRSSRRW